MRIHPRTTSIAAALLATAALAAPAVAQQDLRSPDTRDAAAQVRQDLRSPDARDASLPRTAPTFVVSPAPQAVVDTSSGFDWGSAAIGAAAILGLLAIGAGGVVLMRRHHDTTPPAGIVGV